MDRDEPVTVDFVFPPESGAITEPASVFEERAPRLSKCTGCGGQKYILASKMGADAVKGVPASRMYECADCGTYRLG
jgi:hypothetical protein